MDGGWPANKKAARHLSFVPGKAMAGSALLIATVLATAFWAGVLLTVRPSQLIARTERRPGLRRTLIFLTLACMTISGIAVDLWGLQTVLVLGSCVAALAFLSLDHGDSLAATLGGTAL